MGSPGFARLPSRGDPTLRLFRASAATLLAAVVASACGQGAPGPPYLSPKEARHLADLRQLTHGGSNAEAYFSWDGMKLIFQSTREGSACDQIYTMNTDGSGVRLISTGRGRTTCSYFLPGDRQILYASTHHASPECPPPPDRSRGYVWALYDYEIYRARADGSDPVRLTRHAGYDAELEGIHPGGTRVVFTSLRDGDLDLYTMDLDGEDVRRLTFEKGYDGGAFYSWDGTKIVYRAYHPSTPEDVADYERLLAERLVRPVRAELIVMDADGANKRQITDNGAANWAPSWHPNGRQIIFSSNLHAPGTGMFDLYLINLDGSGLERLTFGGFNSFPHFSPDGRRLAFASNRGAKERREFNIFIATWRP